MKPLAKILTKIISNETRRDAVEKQMSLCRELTSKQYLGISAVDLVLPFPDRWTFFVFLLTVEYESLGSVRSIRSLKNSSIIKDHPGRTYSFKLILKRGRDLTAVQS